LGGRVGGLQVILALAELREREQGDCNRSLSMAESSATTQCAKTSLLKPLAAALAPGVSIAMSDESKKPVYDLNER
jgi:hypothetical protein